MPMSRSAMLIASPMPRVPPVTIATRAMIFSPSGRLRRLGRRPPTFKLALHQLLQHGHALGRIVEAVEQREMLATVRTERLAAANAELFQRLKAIGGKAGRCDRDSRDPVFRIG